MKTAIIVDIDGTVALKGDRSPFEWKKVSRDEINPPVVQLLLHLPQKWHIILVSGRDEICRSNTKWWLKRKGIPYHKLFMRPKNDVRKDCIVKKEIYYEKIEAEFHVLFVLDDRNQVVKMWREELGLPCFQVAEGNF